MLDRHQVQMTMNLVELRKILEQSDKDAADAS